MPLSTSISTVAVDLTATIIAVTGGSPRVLVLQRPEAVTASLPSGPLQPEHRTLQAGLRSWVERQTRQKLGYIEQLYTFGDRNRAGGEAHADSHRALTLAYLALVQEPRAAAAGDAEWHDWYAYFPWEDWCHGVPPSRRELLERLHAWAGAAPGEERFRAERVRLIFGRDASGWDEERALERYELLYEAGLVAEAWTDRGRRPPDLTALSGRSMTADHRRILATAISRLRGKIKYRPVLFELMPPVFTLLQLQRTAETLLGVGLHKQNFRRLIEHQRLVEETGELDTGTGGRPAKLMRFRHEVTLERPAPGVRLKAARLSPH